LLPFGLNCDRLPVASSSELYRLLPVIPNLQGIFITTPERISNPQNAYGMSKLGEEILLRRGQPTYHVGVRHEASGRIVAWSVLVFHVDERKHAWQGTTIVDPQHRGHRLGMIVKLVNLQQATAAQPELRLVTTWNAAVNAPMIAINELIGFRAVDAWVEWQRRLDVDSPADSID